MSFFVFSDGWRFGMETVWGGWRLERHVGQVWIKSLWGGSGQKI